MILLRIQYFQHRQGNEIELKDEDEDDEIVYTADHEEELVVGDANDVLDAGFVIDEEGPEDIMDVYGDADDADADTYED